MKKEKVKKSDTNGLIHPIKKSKEHVDRLKQTTADYKQKGRDIGNDFVENKRIYDDDEYFKNRPDVANQIGKMPTWKKVTYGVGAILAILFIIFGLVIKYM